MRAKTRISLFSVRIVIFSGLVVALLACGAEDPLQRGEWRAPLGGSNSPLGLGKPSPAVFETEVLPNLERDCSMCHANPAPDYPSALALIEVGRPTQSVLYQSSVGVGHRPVWRPDRPEAEALARWILSEN